MKTNGSPWIVKSLFIQLLFLLGKILIIKGNRNFDFEIFFIAYLDFTLEKIIRKLKSWFKSFKNLNSIVAISASISVLRFLFSFSVGESILEEPPPERALACTNGDIESPVDIHEPCPSSGPPNPKTFFSK